MSRAKARADQAVANAHLRSLPKCSRCDKPATVQLYNGVNAPMNHYCKPHGQRALREFKAGAT